MADEDLGSPDAIAGDRYSLALVTIQRGDAITILAYHIAWMLGDNVWHQPVWRDRAVPPDGKRFHTQSFDQYLLLPPREGLNLPSLLMVHKMCEADPQNGYKAIAMMQAEIADYDERITADRRTVLDAAPELAAHGEIGRGRPNRCDNITSIERGTSAAYLARRLQRDFAEIWQDYMNEKYRSVRAAALAAGIIKQPTTLERTLALVPKLSDAECTELAQALAVRLKSEQ